VALTKYFSPWLGTSAAVQEDSEGVMVKVSPSANQVFGHCAMPPFRSMQKLKLVGKFKRMKVAKAESERKKDGIDSNPIKGREEER